MSQKPLKRISLMIREEQYNHLAEHEINTSSFIRDLMDDYFSHSKITLAVGEKTRQLYDKVISHTGSTDADLEPYLEEALHQLLRDRIKAMQKLEVSLEKNTGKGRR